MDGTALSQARGAAERLLASDALRRRAEADIISCLCELAETYGSDEVELIEVLLERRVQVGGDGTPTVSEFLSLEVAGLLRCTPIAAANRISDALNLKYRHPRLYAAVQELKIDAARALKAADRCVPLHPIQADAVTAVWLVEQTGKGWTAAFNALDRLIIESDTALAAEREAKAREDRGVWVWGAFEGVMNLSGRLDVTDARLLDDRLSWFADLIKVDFPGLTLEQRRAKALGVLTDPHYAAALLDAAAGQPQLPSAERHCCGHHDHQPDALAPESSIGAGAAPARAQAMPFAGASGAGHRLEPASVGSPTPRPTARPPQGPASDGLDPWFEGTAVPPPPDPADFEPGAAGTSPSSWPAGAAAGKPAFGDYGRTPFAAAGDDSGVASLGQGTSVSSQPQAVAGDGSTAVGTGNTLGRGRVSSPSRHRPTLTLNVHIHADAMGESTGVARVERGGHITTALLCELIGEIPGLKVRVQPVIDLPNLTPADAYVPTRVMRRAAILAFPHEPFPFSNRSTETLDLDHTAPFEPGRCGQTRLDNLAPLSRRVHRAKTAGWWTVDQPTAGQLCWTSPLGYRYLALPGSTQVVTGGGSRLTTPGSTSAPAVR